MKTEQRDGIADKIRVSDLNQIKKWFRLKVHGNFYPLAIS
jgi:hypothetical protein